MRRAFLATALLTALAATAGAQTPPPTQEGVSVSNAWARASAGAAMTGAAYATITDNGRADRLTGISTPVAGVAELHETRNENGIMQMRAITDLPLQPGKPLTLKPGGYHVMLMELKHPLKMGDSFPLTFTFEHASPVTVQANIAAAGATAPMSGSMPGMQQTGGSKP